uniref:CSON002927 protein n=1 Tax=Culicoides sonorensis TaxID=179676 RepID=A0A336LIM6_CULSO
MSLKDAYIRKLKNIVLTSFISVFRNSTRVIEKYIGIVKDETIFWKTKETKIFWTCITLMVHVPNKQRKNPANLVLKNRQAFHLSNNEANDKYSSRILDAPVKYSDEVLYHLVKQLSSLNKENLVPTTKNTRNLENENNSEINNNVPDTLNRNKLAEKCSDSIPEDIDEDEHRSIVVRAQCNYKPKKKRNTTTNTPSKKNQNKKCNKKKTKESATAIDDISDIASISTTIGFPGSYDNASFTDPCIVNDISLQRLYSPSNSRRPKNKVSKQQAYHGSLPNNLDDSENDFVLNNQTVSHPQSSISEKLQNETQCSQSNNNAGIGSSISMNNQSLLEIKKFRTKLDKMNTNSLSKRCPLNNRSNKDPAYDPGYVSERSPEEESLPSLLLNNCKKMSEHMSNDIPILENSYDFPLPQYVVENESQKYDFITKDSIFSVHIVKGPRGLGLSVSGGIDSNAPFPGLIRIKRLFPHQAAWSVGVLQQGDIILVVNGVQLTGLTNYEALEILRTTPNEVFMIISRPVDERYRKLSPPVEAPPPPVRKHDISVSLDQCHSKFCGEFEIFLTKQQGSLGFTLRKEDEIVAGHCVRALVREPALTDGRIKPGDKILAVNDISIAGMTHEEAVIFLRKATETVKLRLYRDDTMTPLSTVSPTDIERKALNMSSNSKKVVLRPEAINLLSDLAYRKQYSGGDESTGSSINSSSASPRRLKRIQKSPRSSTSGSQGSSSNTFMQQSGTDSDTSTIISHGTTSFRVQQVSSHSSIDYSNNCIVSEPENELEEEFYNEDELLSMVDEDTYYGERPGRPNYLNIPNLLGNTQKFTPKQTQTQFKMANGHELNNLNNEILDAPTVYTISSSQSDMNDEFASLPCETFLVECKNKSDLDQYSKYVSKYGYGNPLYQSSQNSFNNENGSKSLLKWKGTMLSTDNNNENTDSKKDITINKCSETYKTQSGDSNCDIPSISNSSRILSRSTSIDNDINIDSEGKQLITVELNRGWNSRLGFSITKDKNDGHIYISAVYVDSVAARDGRLRKYDRILTVNEELIEGKEKHEVIDLLRTLRGSIVITVTREYHNTQSSYPVNYDIGCETEGEN